MKILCVSYRNWAFRIYEEMEKQFTEHTFYKINSKKEYCEKEISKIKPDIILFYGWSWIIRKETLKNYNCFMLHPSKLPEFRGGSPIQNQIIRGVKNSAVTIFKMDDGIDTGDIMFQKYLSLDQNLDCIFEDMTKLGIEGTTQLIDKFPNIEYTKQDNKKSSYFKRRKKSESEITLNELKEKNSDYIFNKIRMLKDPYPNAYIRLSDGKRLLIKSAIICD